MSDETQEDKALETAGEAAFDAALDAWTPAVRPEDIRRRGEIKLTGEAPEALRSAIAERLGLLALRHFAWRGALGAERGEIAFDGVIEADLDQSCVVTLEPAPERIDEPVSRRWLPPARYAERIAALALRPEDDAAFAADSADQERGALGLDLSADGADEIEPLGDAIRLGPVLVEALALALTPYPRAPGVAFDGALAAPEGVAPLDDQASRPFAGLADLKARFEQSGDSGPPEDKRAPSRDRPED